jgi:GNAT superfamily N-acetyltransferase
MIYTITTTKNELLLRPTQPADFEPLIEWCHTLWDGDQDYIADTLPFWLEEGNLFTGVRPDDPFPLILIRLRQLAPTEAWFGGLRIHPSLQGQGVGQALIEFSRQWANDHGAQTLGYMTEYRNHRMHYLGQKLGFTVFGAFHMWRAKSTTVEPLELVVPSAVPTIDEGIQHAQHGRYVHDWTLLKLTPERIAYHLANGELFTSDDASGWVLVDGWDEEEVYLGQTSGNPATVAGLIAGIQARLQPHQRLLAFPWDDSPAAEVVKSLGWEQLDEQYRLFERPV